MYPPEILKLYSPLPSLYQPAVKQSLLGHFLVCPDPQVRRPLPSSGGSLHVLTNSENLKRIKEKREEEKMERKAREKAERAKAREAKKLMKEKVCFRV